MTAGISLGELAEKLGASLNGDADIRVNRITDIEHAGPDGVSFISSKTFLDKLEATKAGAVIIKPEWAAFSPVAALLVDDPYLGYAKAAQLLDSTPQLASEVHPSAQLAPDVSLAVGVCIGANAVVDSGVTLGRNVQIGAGSVIGKDTVIEAETILKANVTIYHHIHIGQRTLVHSGSVIGADGFGFANESGHWLKIPQLGGVVIGDDVEIGSNCTIDRGALKNTLIGNGVKLDNMIHIAHNVVIGDHTAMAACVGVAGGTVLGERCTVSGGVSIIGHLNIPAGTHFTVCTVVNKSPVAANAYSSGSGMMTNKDWRKSVARFKQLDQMAKKIKQLEKQLQQHQKNN